MTKYDTGKLKAPFCTFEGLNYSNVLNLSKRTVSVRKYKKLDTKKEPLGFNISYHYLTAVSYTHLSTAGFHHKS